MWFLGVVGGLIIGGMMESSGVAILMAVIGGFVVHVATRPKVENGSSPSRFEAKSVNSADSEVAELHRKVTLLEQRMQVVEKSLATGMSEPETSVNTTFLATIKDTAPIVAEADESVPSDWSDYVSAQASGNNEIAGETPEDTSNETVFTVVSGTSPVFDFVEASEDEEIPETATNDNSVSSVTPLVYEDYTVPEPRIPFKDRLPSPIRSLIYGGNTLVKAGVLILFLGLAFLLRYTTERVTVPIEFRYAAVALIGAILLSLGWYLRRRRTDYALILQGMGVGVFYLTTLAAMKFHMLLPSEVGFVFMFLVSLLGAALAILQKAPVLAIIAALEGFATPILTSTGGNHMMGLMTYLVILDAGIVLVAWFNAWRILNVIGFVGTFTLTSGWANQYYTDEQYFPVQAFLAVFFLLFTAVGILFARRTLLDAKSAQIESTEPVDAADSGTANLAQRARATLAQVGRVDSALVFGTPLTAFGLQYVLTKSWEFGPAFSAMALSAFYLVLASLVLWRERVGLALLAEAYAIMGVIFGTLAIPLGLEGKWTGAAWAVEGAGMYWLGIRQNRAYSRAFAYLVLLGASYKLLVNIGINGEVEGPLLYGSTIGPVLLALSAFSIWLLNGRAKLDVAPSWEVIPGRLALWLGMASLTVLPWQWFTPRTAAAVTALFSVMTYFVACRFKVVQAFNIVGTLQTLAIVSFLSTLQFMIDVRADVVFDGGWPGLLAALVIALSILLTAGWSMATTRRDALDENLQPLWSGPGVVAVVIGAVLLHLALLFEFSMQTAAAATAILSIGVYITQRRFEVKPLSIMTNFMQGLAVVSFMITLHHVTDAEVNAVLESGWRGMVAAVTIATSILFTVGWSMFSARKAAQDNGLSPTWSTANILAVISGTILLHLAMLFAVNLEQAALIWPISSCLVFWVALRMSHMPLAGVAGGLQVVSAVLFWQQYENLGVAGNPSELSGTLPIESITSFAHLQFLTPLVLGLVAWLCGDWICTEAKRIFTDMETASQPEEKNGRSTLKRWLNPWCSSPQALWLPIGWGLIWWTIAWLDETNRVLDVHAISEYFTTSVVAIILATSVALTAVARWRDWSQMSMVTLLTLPALVLGVCLGFVDFGADYLPSAYLGVLVWPLALVWHLRLLRLQGQWLSSGRLQYLHVAGFWLFLLLASRESQAYFNEMAATFSSWSMLGWVLVPALCFWLLCSPILERRWPLSEFRRAYLEIACLPVAVYLVIWCFVSNILSSGNASPLPYFPVLNPLELGQWLVLVALLLWWRALADGSAIRLPSNLVKALAITLGWCLLTGMVLRCCHHWGDVAWRVSALFDSHLTQAALSIAWALMGMAGMLFGNRRASRGIWVAGVVLLAVVVIKLFIVELADRGGLYRIVSFIGVGVLLLIVGYFAPVPVKITAQPDKLEKEEPEGIV